MAQNNGLDAELSRQLQQHFAPTFRVLEVCREDERVLAVNDQPASCWDDFATRESDRSPSTTAGKMSTADKTIARLAQSVL